MHSCVVLLVSVLVDHGRRSYMTRSVRSLLGSVLLVSAEVCKNKTKERKWRVAGAITN